MRIGLRGCLILGSLTIGCCAATGLALRFAVPRMAVEPRPEAPIDVSGDCPPDVVAAYFERQPDRLEDVLGQLSVFSSESNSIDAGADMELLEGIDVQEMRMRRDAVAAESVPDCLKGVQAEELALMDLVIDAVETGQGDGPPPVRAGLVVTKLLAGVPPIMERSREAREGLEERLGIDLSGRNGPSR